MPGIKLYAAEMAPHLAHLHVKYNIVLCFLRKKLILFMYYLCLHRDQIDGSKSVTTVPDENGMRNSTAARRSSLRRESAQVR